ncbi:MAG: 30S ribosomal protein S17 [Chlamydiae bacterium RIFCSPHIGHO2_12_FULL_27_8]|nr:MAG: 30S ribosomal protein S17 [Chlamydiae bacterium RIFCSPHIGHO2_12_FULL_27_8]OGN64923.1 MAG: 30S ribosomal protein S17 [Chlamydiae bacterium RIFCSPLOWO2_01_FULL_28_7]
MERNTRKILDGIVVSDKMQNTVVVKVVRKLRHPKYGKVIEKWKKVYAHDENNSAKIGQKVQIMETRPLSKLKRFRIVKAS